MISAADLIASQIKFLQGGQCSNVGNVANGVVSEVEDAQASQVL